MKILDKITDKLIKKCSNKSANFIDRIDYLIKTVIPYSYPEKKDEYIPHFDKPVFIEKNKLINKYNYKKALKKLKSTYDLSGLEFTYNNLADEYSKDFFLMVIVYRLIEEVKLRFPAYYTSDFKDFEQYESMCIDNTIFKTSQFELKTYNLNKIGYNVILLANAAGIAIEFVLKQYSYEDKVVTQKGDYVIEGGGCFGDTALYFADLVKENGKVFSFEFVKNNLDVFRKNMELNPHYKNIIEIIERPLGLNSNQKLYAIDKGSATSISSTPSKNAQEYTAITIDDFINERNLAKVDFIKLDIEGGELYALKAAVNTIKKFKPKLAICLYHKNTDFWQIPQFIKEIVPEYKLYLKHNTISIGETVLYCCI